MKIKNYVISFYESQISKAFNAIPLILTDGTRIEFRKLN